MSLVKTNEIQVRSGSTVTISSQLVIGSGLSGWDGWINANETWLYASADSPTFTFTVPADVTLKYQAGQRIKLTQVATVKYFIITAVSEYSGGNTTITVYGGTYYTLTNNTITGNCYSMMKAPLGFPLSPSKWTVEVTDTSDTTQTSPVNGTWYNLGTITISIPIGLWHVSYKAFVQCILGSSTNFVSVTLSTANNSESDVDLTQFSSGYDRAAIPAYVTKVLSLASKTSYYLNEKVGMASATNMSIRGSMAKTIIRAECAYL